MLEAKKAFIDLKFVSYCGHSSVKEQKGVANEYRKNHFLTSDGFFANIRISQMCATLSRKLQNKKFLMFRPVSMYGICSTYLSGKPSRYRSMPSRNTKQTLSYWNQKQSVEEYNSKRKRKTQLAHIRPSNSATFLKTCIRKGICSLFTGTHIRIK